MFDGLGLVHYMWIAFNLGRLSIHVYSGPKYVVSGRKEERKKNCSIFGMFSFFRSASKLSMKLETIVLAVDLSDMRERTFCHPIL